MVGQECGTMRGYVGLCAVPSNARALTVLGTGWIKDSHFVDEGRILLLFRDTFGIEGESLLCSSLQRHAVPVRSLRRLLPFVLEMS